MSKASQRRQAEQHKRHAKKGWPSVRDAMATHKLGDDAIHLAPKSFWRFAATMGGDLAAHGEDAQLLAFFHKHKETIEACNVMTALSGKYPCEPTPGIAIHGRMASGAIDEPFSMRPLGPHGNRLFREEDQIFEALDEDRRKCELPDANVSLWFFGAPYPGEPTLCMGMTQNGARLLRLKVAEDWITGKREHLVNEFLNKLLLFKRNGGGVVTSHEAFFAILDLLKEKSRDGEFSPQSEETKQLALEVQKNMDRYCSAHVDIIKSLMQMLPQVRQSMDEAKAKEEALQEELKQAKRDAAAEIKDLKGRWASERAQRSVAHGAAAAAVTGQQPKESLATRLGAFF